MEQRYSSQTAAQGAAAASARLSHHARNALDDGLTQLTNTASRHANAGDPQLAGRLFEDLHAATGSANAARNGLDQIRFVTGDELGLPTDAADLFVQQGGETVARAQLKCCGSNTSTTSDIAQVKYDGMQRVVPTDQAKHVRDLAQKRGVDGLGKRNYPETAKTTSDRVRHGRAQSDPVTRQQALDAATDPAAAARRLVRKEAVRGIRNATFTGATIGGSFSLVQNIRAVRSGEKDAGEAAVAVAKDTAIGGAVGAVTSTATIAIRSTCMRAGARSLARSNVPFMTSLLLVDLGKDGCAFVNGSIDGAEFGKRAVKNTGKAAATWGGMEGGAALGTMIWPGIGTVAGGIFGGICGALFGDSLMSALMDEPEAQPTTKRIPARTMTLADDRPAVVLYEDRSYVVLDDKGPDIVIYPEALNLDGPKV